MLVWNRRTQTLLTLAVGSAAATVAVYGAVYGAASDFLLTHPTIDLVVAIVGGSMPLVFCATLFAFIVSLGDDQTRLARAGRVTAAIMAILWPWFAAFCVVAHRDSPGPIALTDAAFLVGMPVIGIVAGYFGFRDKAASRS